MTDIADDLAPAVVDFVSALLRQGYTVAENRRDPPFGDVYLELAHGHRGVLILSAGRRWNIDVRLLDRWYPPAVVEASLQGRSIKPQPMSIEAQVLCALGVVQGLPSTVQELRNLRDEITRGRHRGPISLIRRKR